MVATRDRGGQDSARATASQASRRPDGNPRRHPDTSRMTGSSLSPRPPPEPPILASQGSVSDLAGIAVGEGSFTGFGAPLSAPCSPLPAFAGTCCAEWIPACAGMTALCGGFRYPLLAPRFRGHVVRMDDETDESVPRSPLSRACPSQAQTPRDDGERRPVHVPSFPRKRESTCSGAGPSSALPLPRP